MKRGDRVRLTLASLAFGGDAVGRASDGRTLFVAGGAPGDEVEVVVEEVKRSFARAQLAQVIAPGASRVAARCPLVPECGGCQWQEVAIATQQAAKQSVVERALGRLGAEVAPLLTPCAPFGYRTRARFTVAAGAIGYQSRRSHAVVDVPGCPLLDPALDAALAEARRALACALPTGATLSGLSGRDGAVHLAVGGAPPSIRERAQALVGRAGIAGVALDGAVRLGAPDIDTATDGEAPFFAAADGFAQAGSDGNRALRRLVASLAGDGARVLELHAGDGNFSRDLATDGRALFAVEGDARAVDRLRRNVPRAQARCEPVERAAERLAAAGERFDLVLIDPPRAGARAILPSLARLTDRLIYVSCDPMTLARDAADLAALGLRPLRATALDLTPHTYHVEVVCLLIR